MYYEDFCILNIDDLPNIFIKLSNLTMTINTCNIPNNTQLYFSVDENLLNRGNLSNVCIDSKNNEGKMEHLAYLYKHFKYTTSIRQMLNNKENINYYKMYITTTNKIDRYDTKYCIMNINFYIKKSFMLDLYEKPEIPLIVYNLIKSLNTTKKYYNNIKIPSCKFFPIINKNINLLRVPFYYQKENYSWMINLENQIENNNLSYETFLYITNNIYKYYYIEELDDYIILNNNSNTSQNPYNNKCIPFNIYGGILADEIGLGKTFSMICLIKYKYNVDLNSTLIVCPKRLCLQWQTEINNSVKLTSYIITNILQFRKYCKNKIKYDIVILSYEFFINTKYKEYCSNNDLPNDKFMIETYEWERIILDEGHEYITCNDNLKKKKCREISFKLHTLRSKYRWICSGTPFSTSLDLWEVIRFLTKNNPDTFPSILKLDDYYMHTVKNMNKTISEQFRHASNDIINIICRQNTKERVSCQVKIPKTNIYNVFLKMTKIEKVIYDSALDDIDKQYELCNHILISDQHIKILGNTPFSLNEIHIKMVEYYKKNIKYHNTRYINITNNLEEYNNVTGDPEIYKSLLLKKEETELKLAENNRKLIIFEKLEDKIKEEENCPICFDKLSDIHNGILDCGHFICCKCINTITKYNSKCPLCRQPIVKNQIKVVSPENLKIESKLGTKISNLIKCCKYTIKQSENNRIIIFSRWDSMLKLLSKILNEHNINHLILNGSYYMINSKIRKFRLDTSIRIILLSSEKAASGLNLTEANHIILLDTLNNDPDISKVIEEQAIGRAVRIGQTQNVKVTRFIMKDTVEEDFYNKLNKKYIEKDNITDILQKKGLVRNIIVNILNYMEN